MGSSRAGGVPRNKGREVFAFGRSRGCPATLWRKLYCILPEDLTTKLIIRSSLSHCPPCEGRTISVQVTFYFSSLLILY